MYTSDFFHKWPNDQKGGKGQHFRSAWPNISRFSLTASLRFGMNLSFSRSQLSMRPLVPSTTVTCLRPALLVLPIQRATHGWFIAWHNWRIVDKTTKWTNNCVRSISASLNGTWKQWIYFKNSTTLCLTLIDLDKERSHRIFTINLAQRQDGSNISGMFSWKIQNFGEFVEGVSYNFYGFSVGFKGAMKGSPSPDVDK